METPKKESTFEYPHAFVEIFLVFCDIKIDCKKKLNTSLDAEFNALAEYITCIEKIDFENPEKSEKNQVFNIITQFPMFLELFSR